MFRIALCVIASATLLTVALFARTQTSVDAPASKTDGFQIKSEEKNPWTHLKPNTDPSQFQFAVITDRTGGHRANIFAKAVHQINLLQPEFVLSVGDLIEGYTTKQERIDTDWNEFNGFIKQLEMPFFYVPGNHDLTNKELVADWGGRFGRKYYHFIYKNVLFLAVNSEDPVSKVSEEQAEYFKKVLEENPAVRWTLVFTHKPLWTATDLEKNGWAAIEKALGGRKYTVFCGHVHRYEKFVRNGMNYYQLATTGGGSRLRGVEYGEFDHISWITMKPEGPRIANVILDGVLSEDLTLPETNEPVAAKKVAPTVLASGRVLLNGQPVAGATVTFHKKNETTGAFSNTADGFTDANGIFRLSTYKAFDGVPAGEYVVSIVHTGKYYDGEKKLLNMLDTKYATAKVSSLRATVKAEGPNEFTFDLMK